MVDQTLTITLPLPVPALSPNGRAHWRKKAQATKGYRAYARMMATVQARGVPQQWPAATVQATFYHKQNRRRDADNALASIKAALDGLADAGVVANDSGLTHLPVRFAVDKHDPRLVLTVTREGGR